VPNRFKPGELAQQARASGAVESRVSTAMLTQPELTTGLRLPNTLTPSSTHATTVISHFLRKLYGDMLAEDFP
jgi:hypothetical protein